jgi:hypothetical protein
MQCRHCGVRQNLSKHLCDICASKALQILPSNPKERIHIYALLMKSENPIIRICAEELMKDDVDIIEQQMDDPIDRMFERRD